LSDLPHAHEAIVLGHQDLGETDRIVRLAVVGRGRVDAVARGARASRRRFSGALDPGTRLWVELRQSRGSMPYLGEVEVRHSPSRARSTLGRLTLLAWGCELIGSLVERELDADRLQHLLEVWLDLLEGEVEPRSASRLAFEAKALAFAGLRPALTRCAVCSRPIADPCLFSEEAGGAAHVGCAVGRSVAAADLAAIEALLYTPLLETPGREAPDGARMLLVMFAEHQIGRALKARDMLVLEGG
jgi:DNA repair protein RecO (recombination protein O)